VRRLAAHYPDSMIAGILNRQGRKSAYGHRFTANLVGSLPRQWDIPRFERAINPPEGELLNIKQIVAELGVASKSMTQSNTQHLLRAIPTASSADLPGR